MKCVIEYLINSAKNYPDKIAVIEEDNVLTYQELNQMSKSVATKLISLTDSKEPIGIFMDKGINALISFMGTIYSGCFYSTINTSLPDSRIDIINKTLRGAIIITDLKNYDKAKKLFDDKKILLIEKLKDLSINEESIFKRTSKIIDTDPIYCNFTSGSTGTPKGVLVANRSIIDFIDNFTSVFTITSDDIIANQAPFDFDVSVKDIYSALKTSATLLIIPKSYFSNPSKLLDYIIIKKATTLIWAVSALCLITSFHGLDYKVPTDIRLVIFSGEVMPKKHLDIWMAKLEHTEFINVYGPTEITCNCTYHKIDRNTSYDKIPIGIPFENERVFLLDESDEEITTDNKIGEICVSGSCLALGYYNNESETQAHFTKNPLNKNYHELIYRTGDLGYKLNGEFYFQGRKDFQIKLMGHRIELEEIDACLEEIDGIERSITIFIESRSRLFTFFVGTKTNEIILKHLKEHLPNYMIPNKIIKIENFPLNKNGKVDRQKLIESLD